MLVTLLITGVPGATAALGTSPADTAHPTVTHSLALNSSAASPAHTSNISTTDFSSGLTIIWYMFLATEAPNLNVALILLPILFSDFPSVKKYHLDKKLAKRNL